MPINYSDYPKNWKEIRKRILERATNKCEHCGVENHTYRVGILINKHGVIRKRTYIVLSIAHLDHDKENHDVSDNRLAALCQACHFKYDLSRHIENRRYGRNFRMKQFKLF
ncbi:MAG: hypothetical protein WBP45_13220 [Daejeonella sp.]